MSFLDQFKRLKKSLSPHLPLIEIFIFKANLLHNLRQYRNHYPNLKFAPVLKANAYGHGLEQVLSVLRGESLPFICVDSHFELRIARKYAPDIPALVIGYCRLSSIEESDFNTAIFTVVSLEQLKELSAGLKKPRRFHLKLDTGMRRQGIMTDSFSEAIRLITANKNIRLEGLCSHLADPDNEIETAKQIEHWNRAVKYFKNKFPKITCTHLSATGGIRYSAKIDADTVRLGIGFYGINEYCQDFLDLKPALEMRSIITGTKTIRPGDSIGYGFDFTAKEAMQIATVPVGYFEGVDRRLSNKGYFKIGRSFCPILGRVSMDISTIDVSQVPSVAYLDEVVIISCQPEDKNSIQNIANACNTIPYDILVRIPSLLSRKLI